MTEYFEKFDLVCMPNRTLGLISRLPHDDDSSSDDDSSDYEQHSDHLPQPQQPSHNRRLITSYEDVENIHSADPHLHEHPFSPSHPGSSRVPQGFAEVTNFHPLLHKADDLTLIDRVLERNRVVTHSSRPFQSATVIHVHKKLTVRRISSITNPSVLPADTPELFELPQSQLGFFFGMRQGNTVVCGDRIGIVASWSADVYVVFPDGSLAFVPSHDEHHPLFPADKLTPSSRPIDPNMEGIFYPGQTVKAPPETWLHTAVWLCGAYASVDTAVVTQVRMRCVLVKWVAQNPMSTAPPIHDEFQLDLVPYSDLILLDEFRESSWCVGDRGFLVNSRTNLWKKGGVVHATVPFSNEAPRREYTQNHNQHLNQHRSAHPRLHSSADQQTPHLPPSDQQDRPAGRFFMAQRRARREPANSEYFETPADMIPPSAVEPKDVVQVVATKTYVTLRWQDGTIEENVPTVDLRTNDYLYDNDFAPGELVVRQQDAAFNNHQGNAMERRLGAIVRVNNTEKTATVEWLNTDPRINSRWHPQVEEVSVYELVHQDYDCAIGDVVLNFNPKSPLLLMDWVGVINELQRGEATVKWLGGETSNVNCTDIIVVNSAANSDDTDDEDESEDDEEEEEDEEEEREYNEGDNDSGPVPFLAEYGGTSGEVPQNWDDANELDTHPVSDEQLGRVCVLLQLQALLSVRKLIPKLTQSSIKESVQVGLKNALEVVERKRMRLSSNTLTRDDISTSAAILVTRTVSELHTMAMLQGDSDHAEMREEESGTLMLRLELQDSLLEAFNTLMTSDCESGAPAQQHQETGPQSGVVSMDVDSQQAQPASQSNPPLENGRAGVDKSQDDGANGSLQTFDVLDEIHDFHFARSDEQPKRTQMFLFVVSKEWRRLRTSLPPGIVVRVCEQQNNIMRAAIIGSEETPYADTIFFFDIVMGPRYPVKPPRVWFRSYGRRLNPNLYEDGEVCLSILGTWDGDDIESWHPKTSNLLRVLLSLQALVFVEEPYYNEVGYGKQRGTPVGENNSRAYNENLFLLCVKHLISTLEKRQTPSDCYEIAAQHYKAVGPRILARCRALVRGDVAEASVCSASKSSEDRKRYSSAGFRKSLEQLLPSLEHVLNPLILGDSSPET